jgi:hypothetical protein
LHCAATRGGPVEAGISVDLEMLCRCDELRKSHKPGTRSSVVAVAAAVSVAAAAAAAAVGAAAMSPVVTVSAAAVVIPAAAFA